MPVPVVTAVYATSAVGGLVSPTSANKPAGVARLVAAATCAAAFGDAADVDSPADEPPGLPQLVPAGSAERGEADLRASLLLTTGVLVGAVLVSVLAALRTTRANSVLSSCAAALTALGLTYLGPDVTQYAVTLLAHGAESASTGVAVACVAASVATTAVVGRVCLWPSAEGAAGGGLQHRLREGVWSPFHDGSRDGSVLRLRAYVFEDIAVGTLLAALSGVRPTTEPGCRAVAASMLVLTLGHAAYTGIVRPQLLRVDLVFAAVNAAVLLAIALLTAVVVFLRLRSALEPLGYVLVAVDAVFFVQIVVLGYFGLRTWCATEKPSARQPPTDGGVDPLLAVPMVAMAEHAAVVNPLAQQGHSADCYAETPGMLTHNYSPGRGGFPLLLVRICCHLVSFNLFCSFVFWLPGSQQPGEGSSLCTAIPSSPFSLRSTALPRPWPCLLPPARCAWA